MRRGVHDHLRFGEGEIDFPPVLATLRGRLPVMPDAEIAILVETWVGYSPTYSVGLADFTFQDLVVTRPRFAGQLCTNSSNTGGLATATC